MVFTETYEAKSNGYHTSVNGQSNSVIRRFDLGRNIARQASGHEQGQRARAQRIACSVGHDHTDDSNVSVCDPTEFWEEWEDKYSLHGSLN